MISSRLSVMFITRLLNFSAWTMSFTECENHLIIQIAKFDNFRGAKQNLQRIFIEGDQLKAFEYDVIPNYKIAVEAKYINCVWTLTSDNLLSFHLSIYLTNTYICLSNALGLLQSTKTTQAFVFLLTMSSSRFKDFPKHLDWALANHFFYNSSFFSLRWLEHWRSQTHSKFSAFYLTWLDSSNKILSPKSGAII